MQLSKFTLGSCGGIRHAYSWTIVLNDKRRARSLRGKAPFHDSLTGLTLRCHGMTGFKSTAEKTCHPELDRLPEEEAPEEVLEEGLLADPVLEPHTKTFRGWRCSYCKLEEHSAKHVRFHEYLAKQCAELDRVLRQKTVESRRHLRSVNGPDVEQARRTKKAHRETAERQYYRELRLEAAEVVGDSEPESEGQSTGSSAE